MIIVIIIAAINITIDIIKTKVNYILFITQLLRYIMWSSTTAVLITDGRTMKRIREHTRSKKMWRNTNVVVFQMRNDPRPMIKSVSKWFVWNWWHRHLLLYTDETESHVDQNDLRNLSVSAHTFISQNKRFKVSKFQMQFSVPNSSSQEDDFVAQIRGWWGETFWAPLNVRR